MNIKNNIRRSFLGRSVLFAGIASLCIMPVQADYASYMATYKLITDINHTKQKDLNNWGLGSSVSRALRGIAWETGFESANLKKHLFKEISTKRLNGYASVLTDYEANYMRLLYYTRGGESDALTDRTLKSKAAKNGAYMKAQAKKHWALKSITPTLVQSLESYNPWWASQNALALCELYYYVDDKPQGASGTTSASMSYVGAMHDIYLVELAKKSVVVKLLHRNRYLVIPTSTSVSYSWSGWPDTIIPLDPITWTLDDVPQLRNLLDNPFYKDMAKECLIFLGQ